MDHAYRVGAATALEKFAVSAEWLSNMVRSAMTTAKPARVGQFVDNMRARHHRIQDKMYLAEPAYLRTPQAKAVQASDLKGRMAGVEANSLLGQGTPFHQRQQRAPPTPWRPPPQKPAWEPYKP